MPAHKSGSVWLGCSVGRSLMNFKSFVELLKETFSEWSEDKAQRLAAALAYYTIFSVAPLLVIAIAVASFIFSRFGGQGVQSQVVAQIGGLVGGKGADLIKAMIQGALKPSSSILATVIGVATLLFGATGLFVSIQDALNTVWEVTADAGSGVLGMVKNRLLSFAMVLLVGFLLLLSMLVSIVLSALTNYFGGFLPDALSLSKILNPIIFFALITLLFAMIYKFLPDVEISWGDVWIGAAVTSLLFNIGKYLIGLYLANSSVASVYGAAGSLAVLLIWIYYSAMIFLLGAEFTQVYAKKFGSRILPLDYAISEGVAGSAEEGMPGVESEVAAIAAPEPMPKLPAPEAKPQHREPVKELVGRLRREHFAAVFLGLIVGLLFGRITHK
jgi:membrane protein